MSKIFSNIAARVAAAFIVTGFMAGGAFAAAGYTVNVTLPGSVTVGKTVLPGGQYKISEITLGSGESAFLFRDGKGDTAAVIEALKNTDPADSQKTEVVLAPMENGTYRLDKMFVEGDAAGYQFINAK